MFKKVLVPVDLAEADLASPALVAAVNAAKESGGEVRIVSVMQIMPNLMSEYLPADFEASQRTAAEESVKKIASGLGLAPEKVSVAIRSGSVHHEVLDLAEQFGADLIVISSHKPGLRTYFLGSNAAHIVRHAQCSVLVIRA